MAGSLAGGASRWAGRALLATIGLLLALHAVGVARDWDELRPVAPGDVAPLFDLPRADGHGSISLEKLRGKVVLVDFWATWCRPCRQSMPVIERAYLRHRDAGLEVVSVNTEGRAAAPHALHFAQNLGLTFPIVMDDGWVFRAYRGSSIPYMLLIDRQGVVRWVHRGLDRKLAAFENDLDARIRDLVGAPQP